MQPLWPVLVCPPCQPPVPAGAVACGCFQGWHLALLLLLLLLLLHLRCVQQVLHLWHSLWLEASVLHQHSQATATGVAQWPAAAVACCCLLAGSCDGAADGAPGTGLTLRTLAGLAPSHPC